MRTHQRFGMVGVAATFDLDTLRVANTRIEETHSAGLAALAARAAAQRLIAVVFEAVGAISSAASLCMFFVHDISRLHRQHVAPIVTRCMRLRRGSEGGDIVTGHVLVGRVTTPAPTMIRLIGVVVRPV